MFRLGLCAMLILSPFAVTAEQKQVFQYSACVGLYADRCPAGSATYTCGTSMDEVEKTICRIHRPDGSTAQLTSNHFQTGFFKGNRCDYTVYTVICYKEEL